MKRDKISNKEWLAIIERYYDALTTPQEEQALKRFLASPAAGDPCFDEIKATLSYFAASRPKSAKRKRIAATLARTAAAAAILAGIIIPLWQADSQKDICIAYVNGRIETDETFVMQQMHQALRIVSRTTTENSIEQQLSSMFNTTYTEEE